MEFTQITVRVSLIHCHELTVGTVYFKHSLCAAI